MLINFKNWDKICLSQFFFYIFAQKYKIMTINEFKSNRIGQVWMVNTNKPYTVMEFKGIISDVGTIRREYPWSGLSHYYFDGFRYEEFRDNDIVLSKLSNAKKQNRIKFVNISSWIRHIKIDPNILNNEKIESNNHIFFFNKKDAYGYVIEKIKRKKLELNALIIKAREKRFAK